MMTQKLSLQPAQQWAMLKRAGGDRTNDGDLHQRADLLRKHELAVHWQRNCPVAEVQRLAGHAPARQCRCCWRPAQARGLSTAGRLSSNASALPPAPGSHRSVASPGLSMRRSQSSVTGCDGMAARQSCSSVVRPTACMRAAPHLYKATSRDFQRLVAGLKQMQTRAVRQRIDRSLHQAHVAQAMRHNTRAPRACTA
jgi:hypothetical protein